MNLLRKNFTGALSLAGGCTVILDILQPIAPFACYAAIASLLIIVAQVILLKTNIIDQRNKNNLERLLAFMVLIFVLSSGSFVAQKVIGATDKGLIANKVEIVSELQKSIFGIEDKITEIGENVSSIQEKVGKLKKETSENPRKELANLGISWNGAGFSESVKQGDLHALQLFIDSGFNVYQWEDIPISIKEFLPNGARVSLLISALIEMPENFVESVFLLLKKNGIDLDAELDHYLYSCVESKSFGPAIIQRKFSLLEVASICNKKEKIKGLINAGASVKDLEKRIKNRIYELEKLTSKEKCSEKSDNTINKKMKCDFLEAENEALQSTFKQISQSVNE